MNSKAAYQILLTLEEFSGSIKELDLSDLSGFFGETSHSDLVLNQSDGFGEPTQAFLSSLDYAGFFPYNP